MRVMPEPIPPRFLDLVFTPILPLITDFRARGAGVRCAVLQCFAEMLRAMGDAFAIVDVWRQVHLMILTTVEKEYAAAHVQGNANSSLQVSEVLRAGIKCLAALAPVEPQPSVAVASIPKLCPQQFSPRSPVFVVIQNYVRLSDFIPQLARTTSLLVDIITSAAPASFTPELRLDAMQLLHILVIHAYLPDETLAMIFPGTATGLAKACLRVAERSDVVVASSTVLAELVVTVVGDVSMMSLWDTTESAGDGNMPTLDSRWSAIVETALLTWHRDQALGEEVSPQPSSANEGKAAAFPSITRNASWFKETSARLGKILRPIFTTLRRHGSVSVRLSLTRIACAFLEQCHKSLPGITPLALETLALLSLDAMPSVHSSATLGIKSAIGLHPTLSGALEQALCRALEHILRQLKLIAYGTLDHSLPGSISEAINIAIGLIRITGQRSANTVIQVISSQIFLGDLFAALESLSNAGHSEQTSVTDTGDDSSIDFLRPSIHRPDGLALPSPVNTETLSSKHEVFLRVTNHMTLLFQELGAQGSGLILIENIIDWWYAVQGTHDPRALVTWTVWIRTVSAVASGLSSAVSIETASKRDQPESDMAYFMLQELAKHPALMLPTSRPSQLAMIHLQKLIGSQLTFEHMSVDPGFPERIAHCTEAILRGIAIFFPMIDESQRTQAISFLLYPLLEKLGDTGVEQLLQTATETISVIARACSYTAPRQLLLSNADYIVDQISIKLRNLEFFPMAPVVLRACLRVVGPAMVPYLEDTLEEILTVLEFKVGAGAGSSTGRAWLGESLLSVLESIALALEQTPTDRTSPEQTAAFSRLVAYSERADSTGILSEIQRYLDELSSPSTVSEDMDEVFRRGPGRQEMSKEAIEQLALGEVDRIPEGRSEPIDSDIPPLDEQPPPTVSEKQALAILEILPSHMTSDIGTIRALSLRIFSICAKVARNRSEFLPFVHDAWKSIANRLQDSEALVRFEAVQTTTTLANVCGDFIAARMERDVWPKYRTLLQQQSSTAPKQLKQQLWERKALIAVMQSCAAWLASDGTVPGDATWEMLLQARVWLQAEYDDDVRGSVERLFRTARDNGHADIAWLLLKSAVSAHNIWPDFDDEQLLKAPRMSKWLQDEGFAGGGSWRSGGRASRDEAIGRELRKWGREVNELLQMM